MFRIVIACISMIMAWKWGDWRNWKLYYPTIIFMILGDFVYMFLTFQKPLWIMESPLVGRTFSNLIISFFMYPSVVLIFLPHFLKRNLNNKVLYIAAWTLFFVGFEYLAIKISDMTYYNGWNLLYSLFLDLIIFNLLWIHHKKPLLGICMAAIVGTCIMLYFKIPLPR